MVRLRLILFSFPLAIVMYSGIQGLPENENEGERNRTKLIILGYKHGGTSFTGAIIHSDPRVFYVYEPIWYIKDPDAAMVAVSDKRVPIQERIKEEWLGIPNVPEPLEFVQSLMDCRLTSFTRKFIKYNVESQILQTMDDCVKQEKQGDTARCYRTARDQCASKRVKALKTVRMTMEEARQLMIKDPEWKVLYVVRDPRGNANSRLGQGMQGRLQAQQAKRRKLLQTVNTNMDTQENSQVTTQLKESFIRQCQLMAQDIKSLTEMAHTFEGRILTVRYEDLADDPVRIAVQIFKFINLDLSQKAKETLQVLFSSKGDGSENLRWRVVRDNSSATAHLWRSQLSFELAKLVEEKCRPVFEKMKYIEFKTAREMQDYRIPSREELYGEGLAIAV